tara:strand:- start:140037 stop:141641 length:1605 start_codon:yes stop_codon:yes gene_type:complete
MNVIPAEHCIRLIALCVLAIASAGCNRFTDIYGRSGGTVGEQSLNGFGALRTSFENAGVRTRDVSRLSDRVELTTTIVWTPQTVGGIPSGVTDWFETWLARGDRTLVYIIPDNGSTADYWAEAGSLAPPDQRLEYRRRAARERNRQLAQRLNRPVIASNGWFVLVPLEHKPHVSTLSRDWASPGMADLSFSAEYEVQFHDKDAVEVHNANAQGSINAIGGRGGPVTAWPGQSEVELSSSSYRFESLLTGEALLYPESTPTPETANPNGAGTASSGPGSANAGMSGGAGSGGAGSGGANTGSVAGTAKPPPSAGTNTAAKTAKPTALPTMSKRDLILTAKITSNDWPGSKIIVINSGSLLTNYSFTHVPNRNLAAQLIAEASSDGHEEPLAGFVTTSGSAIPISEHQPGVPKATGMEMLTVWPISLITIHGILFGLVVCLMLFPIFGRPRRIKRASESNFGDHLDAVATLMRRTSGEKYAKHRISEYMKRVRGETQGPWVLPDEPAAKIAAKRSPGEEAKARSGVSSITGSASDS